jgi:hypothetical protein
MPQEVSCGAWIRKREAWTHAVLNHPSRHARHFLHRHPAGELTDGRRKTWSVPDSGSEEVSVVRLLQGSEIRSSPAGATMAGMSTLDYWIYSVGLVLVTLSVLVA